MLKVGHFLWADVPDTSHKVSNHMPPKVDEFSHRPTRKISNSVKAAPQPPDMWQDCYQTGLYPICRSDTELAAVERKQITETVRFLVLLLWCYWQRSCWRMGKRLSRILRKQDRWKKTAYGINLEEDQAGDWGQNAVAQQHSHQMSARRRSRQLLWGQTQFYFSHVCSWVIIIPTDPQNK